MQEQSVGAEQPKKLIDIGDSQLNAFLNSRNSEVISLGKVQEIIEVLEEDGDEEIEDLHEVVKFKLHDTEMVDKLPPGFFYIGGCGRNVLLNEFGEEILKPRDIDLVAIKEFNPDMSRKDELSRQYMEEDYSKGYGLRAESLYDYFTRRDFTVNEVLTDGEWAYATPQALKDLKNKIIRPSQSQKQELSSKLIMKSLRFLLEFKHAYGKASMQEIGAWNFKLGPVRLFDIALHLDKAFQNSDAIGEEFAEVLLQMGIIKVDKNDSDDTFKVHNASTLALFLDQKLDFVFSSQTLRAIIETQIEESQQATKITRATELAESFLHKIKHMSDYRREAV